MTYPDRTRRLDAELRALGAPSDTVRRDTVLAAIGAALMVAGVVVGIVGYAISATTSDPLRQSDAQALGPIAITLAIAGMALFLRFSATRFLRFWLARLVHERQSTDGERMMTAPSTKGNLACW
jgi:hypothetical protein